MEETEIEVGIVGLGPHGTNHAEILSQMGHEVVGADTDPQLRRQFQKQFGATTFDNPTDLFQSGIDAAVIATPNKFHEPAAKNAMNAGLDVLIEKPLAHAVDSAERIHQVAVETEKTCMVGFYHRYRNVCQIVKKYINDGFFGELTHIDAKFIRRRGVPGRGTWYTSSDVAGGGAMIDIGAHLMDLLLFFSGWSEIDELIATKRSDFGQRQDYSYLNMWGEDDKARMYDVEDSMTAACRFKTGITANIEVAWAANTDSSHAYVLRGTEAGAKVRLSTPTKERFETADQERVQLELFETRHAGIDHHVNSEVIAPHNDPHIDQFKTFIQAVRSGQRPSMTNISEALSVHQALERLYDASPSG